MGGDGQLDWSADWRNAEFFGDQVVNIPCRHCLGCCQATAREWAVRSFHEAQLHTQIFRHPKTKVAATVPNSSVVTLTYNEEHLPKDRALCHADFQRFMKRMRQRRWRRYAKEKRELPPPPIRYFMCGEYGGKTSRPHYHSIIYGETFDDRYSEVSRDGQVNQMSSDLDLLWSQPPYEGSPPTNIGRATVDDFSFDAACYVAGYVAKKAGQQGPAGPIEEIVDLKTGEVRYQAIAPEYRKMSTHPGLGAKWIENPANMEAVYSTDTVKILKWDFHPPRYYDTILARHRPDLVDEIKAKRLDAMGDQASEWTPERCAAAQTIALTSLELRSDSL